MKLDLGCGTNKKEGYHGVDVKAFDGVDTVHDLGGVTWPWADNSIEAVHSYHFLEHLTNPQRLFFWDELYRVLEPNGQAHITIPHWSHACAYGDPTHQWPPMSEWSAYYTNKKWRAENAPHVALTCDFDFVVGGSWDGWLESRHEKTFPMAHYINSWRDLIFTLTKKAP